MSTGAIISRKSRIRPPALQVTSQEAEKKTPSTCQLFQISPSVYISGYEAANNPELLASASITHILNLAGESKCPNTFASSFHYFSLKMPDNPKIDILFFLYFAMEFILDSVKSKGKVLVHCVKGTSRAAAVALAYLMIQGFSEQEAYAFINNANPNADPNLGFVCQLRELKVIKTEPKVFCYSSKYDMFVNSERQFGPWIEIVENECTCYIPENSILKQQGLALESVRLWEKFNNASANIVYM